MLIAISSDPSAAILSPTGEWTCSGMILSCNRRLHRRLGPKHLNSLVKVFEAADLECLYLFQTHASSQQSHHVWIVLYLQESLADCLRSLHSLYEIFPFDIMLDASPIR